MNVRNVGTLLATVQSLFNIREFTPEKDPTYVTIVIEPSIITQILSDIRKSFQSKTL